MPTRRATVFAQREEPGRSAASHRWPMYLVTAAHSTAPGQADDLRLPWGEWHARRIGSLQAVCGRSAVTWQYFWTLDFSAAGSRACPECLRVVREEGARRARHPGSDASGADPGDARKAR